MIQFSQCFKVSRTVALLFLAMTVVYSHAQVTLEVQPGLTIPDSKLPWALDSYQGTPQLVPIHRADLSANQHAASIMLGEMKMSIELQGPTSPIQLHGKTPAIYVYIDPEQDKQGIGSNFGGWSFSIVRVLQQKKKRVVETLSNSAFHGPKSSSNQVDCDIAPVSNHWYHIQPKAPMQEGEYALLGQLHREREPAYAVWDFGINLSAPNEADVVVAAAH